ncbi:MAG: glycosyltransferase [Flavobacterium sp.]
MSETILTIFNVLFYVYSIIAIASYLFLAIISLIENNSYLNKNKFVNYKEILASDVSPSISIIAPAYNESLNIVENVRSLISNHYVNYDVIIVNDGSSDDTLEKLIEVYDLIKVEDCIINEQLKTKPLRSGIFKSTNPAFEKITVVDKENGGKADALNLGLNISKNKYVACIDVDCLLLEDSLQKMIKPFLELTDVKVIASGGVVRIANSCVIKNGKLLEIHLPKTFLEKAQVLEYLRAFLLGRMAWSRLNDILIISGAFGMFDKKTVIEVGGYNTKTVGEDMELIVRMRRYMESKKIKYKVAFIPDPLCWTEAPDNYKTFISQRNRWARGTIETIKMHRNLIFNPKYRSLGMVSYPYHLFFERLSPVVEVIGLFYFFTLAMFGRLNWEYGVSFIFMAYLFSVLFSVMALITEEITYNQYTKKGEGYKLIWVVLFESFVYHPVILYASIKGNWDYYFNKKKKWGQMTRKGMGN